MTSTVCPCRWLTSESCLSPSMGPPPLGLTDEMQCRMRNAMTVRTRSIRLFCGIPISTTRVSTARAVRTHLVDQGDAHILTNICVRRAPVTIRRGNAMAQGAMRHTHGRGQAWRSAPHGRCPLGCIGTFAHGASVGSANHAEFTAWQGHDHHEPFSSPQAVKLRIDLFESARTTSASGGLLSRPAGHLPQQEVPLWLP